MARRHHPRGAVEHRTEVVGRRVDSASPVAIPIRTGNSSARCACTAASTAERGDVKAAHTPSPVWLNSVAAVALRRLGSSTSSWTVSAARIASGSASHRRVEPSMSVKRKVRTPEGPALRFVNEHNAPRSPAT